MCYGVSRVRVHTTRAVGGMPDGRLEQTTRDGTGYSARMWRRLAKVARVELARQGPLKVVATVCFLGIYVLVLAAAIASESALRALVGPWGLFLSLVTFVGPGAALLALWFTQKVVRQTVREEWSVRSSIADPQSSYGLPGYPETGPGQGDVTLVESGGLAKSGLEPVTPTDE